MTRGAHTVLSGVLWGHVAVAIHPFIMRRPQQNLTQVLLDAYDGDQDAADRLWVLVYPEMRQMAHRELFGERRGQTLNTTALVHEAYIKLIDQNRCTWQNRAQFYALACKIMRRILVDHARHRNAQKREGRQNQVALEDAAVMATTRSEDLLALDEALTLLAQRDERLADLVECRFFGGLSVEETAEVLGLSVRTVARDWKRAQTHLYRALRPDAAP